MKNAKLTDKTDNYRILSVYIDNIMRKTENHEQQTRLVFDYYTIVIVRSGKIHIEESGQQMILRKGDAIFFEKGKMAIGKALKEGMNAGSLSYSLMAKVFRECSISSYSGWGTL